MELIPEEEEKKTLIFGKYKLTKIIGSGSFGYVYKGINIIDNKGVAVKVEKKDNRLNLLEKESFYLYNLKGIGIPEVISFGYSGKYNILVQTLLGESLGRIFFKNNNYFSLKDICMFSIQILHRIEYVHSKYIIHRDIKPENFLIGEPDQYMIYIIDFGLSKKYKSSRTNKHIQFQLTKKFTGTARYASINAVRGAEQSRRDDLEAIGYMLLFFFNGGKLPWQGVSCKAKAEKYIKIYNMKKNLNFEKFCKNMPKEIIIYMNYCRELEFEQKPDYDYLRRLFENILTNNGNSNDLHFSWIKDLSILKNYYNGQNKITQMNIVKRKASPQSRIYKKLELSREATKEKESKNENEVKLSKKNNSLKNIDNIVVLKTKSHCPNFIIHKRFNSSGDNILKISKDSENFKSGIAQYNISIDGDEQITDKTSMSKKGEGHVKVKDILSTNKELLNNNIIMNNNNLYYFSGNIKDLSKSLALKKTNNNKINELGFEQNNGNNYLNLNKNQNSNYIIHNRVFSSNAINKNQNQNINMVSPDIIKSLSFIKKIKPKTEETKETINLLNSKEFYSNRDILKDQTVQDIYNNKNNKNNNNNNIKKNKCGFKNKYHDLKINNNIIKKQNNNININKNNIYININDYSNNSKKNSKIINKNNQFDINGQIKIKKTDTNTVKKSKKRKIIKMKVKNLPNIINNSLNNLNCKSAANIVKKNTTPNTQQQNLKFTYGQNINNTQIKGENKIKTQNTNMSNNYNNNIEGNINKIKNINIHINRPKDTNSNNYKKITMKQLFKNNTTTNKNSNMNIINYDILNNNQNKIKYKNLRYKFSNGMNEFPVLKSLTRISEIPTQKQRISHGTNNSTINNCNTINNTINSNNNNKTIVSIYNNYNFEKDNNRYGLNNKKNDNINIALDTLNNINKEKSKNYYSSYNGYKIKLNNYKSYIHLNARKSSTLLNMPSINYINNYIKFNNKNNKHYNSQILLNKDYSNRENNSNKNMRNYFSLNSLDKNLMKLKSNKNIYISSSTRPNLNLNSSKLYKIKKIFNELNHEHSKNKKIERNNTQNFMNLNNKFGFNKIKMERNSNSMNIARSKSYLYGNNFINNHNNKIRSQIMDLNYIRPSTNRKNTDILYLRNTNTNYNIYDSKLIDDNDYDDSIYKIYRVQSRDYYNYNCNREKNDYNNFFKDLC